jgi:hypothetical protein
MSNPDQKELANLFCSEIDTYLEYLKHNSPAKRKKLTNKISQLTIVSAILPIIITFLSAYVYIVTQQIIAFFTSLVDVVPPFLIANTKGEMDY